MSSRCLVALTLFGGSLFAGSLQAKPVPPRDVEPGPIGIACRALRVVEGGPDRILASPRLVTDLGTDARIHVRSGDGEDAEDGEWSVRVSPIERTRHGVFTAVWVDLPGTSVSRYVMLRPGQDEVLDVVTDAGVCHRIHLREIPAGPLLAAAAAEPGA